MYQQCNTYVALCFNKLRMKLAYSPHRQAAIRSPERQEASHHSPSVRKEFGASRALTGNPTQGRRADAHSAPA